MSTHAIAHLERIRALPPGLLYPHQADGVAFLISKGRAILADDMGLGKTRQAIAAMNIAAPDGAILVVCPASLKLNWRREIRRSTPHDDGLRSARLECRSSPPLVLRRPRGRSPELGVQPSDGAAITAVEPAQRRQ